MNKRESFKTILTMLVALLGWQCGGVPPTYFYRVDPQLRELSNGNGVIPFTLAVASFKADMLYESDKIVYRNSPYEVQFYHYRRWIAPPKKLVTEVVFSHFESSGAFQEVVRLPSTMETDYILGGHIQAFEEWDEEDAWYGSVAVEFHLQDPSTKEIIWQKVIAEKTKASEKEPVAVVAAISESLNQVIRRSIDEVKSYLRASGNI